QGGRLLADRRREAAVAGADGTGDLHTILHAAGLADAGLGVALHVGTAIHEAEPAAELVGRAGVTRARRDLARAGQPLLGAHGGWRALIELGTGGPHRLALHAGAAGEEAGAVQADLASGAVETAGAAEPTLERATPGLDAARFAGHTRSTEAARLHQQRLLHALPLATTRHAGDAICSGLAFGEGLLLA